MTHAAERQPSTWDTEPARRGRPAGERVNDAAAPRSTAPPALSAIDLRGVEDVVADLCHELLAPLANVLGHVEILRDGAAGALTAPQARIADAIERNGRRMLMLIDELRDGNRGTGRPHAPQRRPVRLAALVDNAGQAVQLSAARRRLDLRVAVDDPGEAVLGDASQLERVLVNLLSNAIKFTPAGGTVSIDAALEGHEVVINVTDTGIGITDDELPRLFERYFRAAAATEQGVPGTGLGLAIARDIVERHDGSLTVDSQPGVGTRATVRLPRACAEPR